MKIVFVVIVGVILPSCFGARANKNEEADIRFLRPKRAQEENGEWSAEALVQSRPKRETETNIRPKKLELFNRPKRDQLLRPKRHNVADGLINDLLVSKFERPKPANIANGRPKRANIEFERTKLENINVDRPKRTTEYERPKRGNIEFKRPKRAHTEIERLEFANIDSERPKRENLDERPKRANIEFERPKRANIEFERPKRAIMENERPKRANIEFERPKRANIEFERPKRAIVENERPKRAIMENERPKRAIMENERPKRANLNYRQKHKLSDILRPKRETFEESTEFSRPKRETGKILRPKRRSLDSEQQELKLKETADERLIKASLVRPKRADISKADFLDMKRRIRPKRSPRKRKKK